MTRKDALMQAGMKLFATNGFHGTKVSDIVREAAVAQGTFYLYFDSKVELFAALLQQFANLLLDTMVSAFSDLDSVNSTAELASLLRTAVHDILMVYRDNIPLARIALREGSSLDPQITNEYEQLILRLAEAGRIILDQAIERELIPPQNTQIVPFCVLGMYERVAYHWLVEDSADIEDLVEALTRYEMLGISGLPSEEMADAIAGRSN